MREMKDSGISWVGEIPKEWSVNRAKYCFVNTKEIAGCRSDRYERLALTMNGVIKRSKDDSNGLQPEKFETYQILRPNELVFKLIDLQNVSTSRVGLSPYLGLVSPAYIILKSNKRVLPAFAEKYFLMLWKNQIFNALGDAGVRSNLNSKDLLELSIPFPSLNEQQRIAEFLDRECGKIDGLKADIQAQIDTLEQYKRSVITEAVTHGLDQSAPMKDSGIAWIGITPTHWCVVRLKYVLTSSLQYGANAEGADYDEKQPRYIRITDITLDNKLKEDGKLSLLFPVAKPYILTNGDILFARSGATVGKTFYYKKEYGISAFAGYLIRARIDNNKACSKFIYYTTLSNVYEVWKNQVFTQSTIQNIGADKYCNYMMPLPPLSEQEAIAEYLDQKCSEIEQIIADKKTQIETLDGYKKSLIFEYVTGKKKVV